MRRTARRTQRLRLALRDLLYVSLSQLARETGRDRSFWREHWGQIPGAEVSAGGRYTVPIRCALKWQEQHRQHDCQVCGNSTAEAVDASAVVGR